MIKNGRVKNIAIKYKRVVEIFVILFCIKQKLYDTKQTSHCRLGSTEHQLHPNCHVYCTCLRFFFCPGEKQTYINLYIVHENDRIRHQSLPPLLILPVPGCSSDNNRTLSLPGDTTRADQQLVYTSTYRITHTLQLSTKMIFFSPFFQLSIHM